MLMGGAERVIANLSNYWVRHGTEVNVIILDNHVIPSFYPLDSSVTVEYLTAKRESANALEAVRNNFLRIRQLRASIRSIAPNAVISVSDRTNVLTILSTAGLGIPIFANEQIYPKAFPLGFPWEMMRSLTYPYATSVVTLTQSGLECFSKRVQRRGGIIFNPASVPPEYQGKALQKKSAKRKTLMALGRLANQKGFDILIAAFGIRAPRHPDWDLNIWGEGPEHANLDALVKNLGLSDRVRVCGATSSPYEKLVDSDLYVMSSRSEGFPLALCEAMACGLPVVSFDCLSGPGELITHGVNGLLVPPLDMAALVESLSRMMSDESLRRKMAEQAGKVIDRFSIEAAIGLWEERIRQSIGCSDE
jgi:glycosyltransferase involved in cell wall biosynthesis